LFFPPIFNQTRSHWPRGLSCSSAAARLLRSWVRISPGAWMSVCSECYMFSGKDISDELITRPEGPTDCGASFCVIKKLRERGGHRPRRTVDPRKQTTTYLTKSPLHTSIFTHI
jgi:hypothetical protein